MQLPGRWVEVVNMSKGRSHVSTVPMPDRAPMPDVLKAVAERSRLEILMSLAKASKNVGSLAKDLGFSADATSRHLGILRVFGLVQCEEMGPLRVYRLGPRWTVNGSEGIVHLALTDPKGLDVEFRFPQDKNIWWYPTPVTVGRCGLLSRRGG
jgi:DNA-binding transcriptional ArsR family regulator